MMQNSKGSHNAEPGSINERLFMQEKIFEVLSQRQTGVMPPKKKILDLIRRLDEGLYKTAKTKEEYTNLETLETRIHLLITPPNNLRYQQQSNANVATGTMLPTPGLPQSWNSNLMAPSSTDNTLVGADGNSMMPSAGNAVNYSMNNTGLSRGLHTGLFGSVNVWSRTMPVSRLSDGEETFPTWNALQSTLIWWLFSMQENVACHSSSCPVM